MTYLSDKINETTLNAHIEKSRAVKNKATKYITRCLDTGSPNDLLKVSMGVWKA